MSCSLAPQSVNLTAPSELLACYLTGRSLGEVIRAKDTVCMRGCRELATGALQKAFADAAAAGRAGLVRELLTAQFPRLARIFEDTIAKLLQDTEVSNPGNASKDREVFQVTLSPYMALVLHRKPCIPYCIPS